MFQEKMILQADKIERLTARLNWTPRIFANAIKVEMPEAYKLLSGEAVNYYTAKAFIVFFRAAFAAAFIDFTAMGMDAPQFLKLNKNEASLFADIAENIRKLQKEKIEQ